MVLTRPLPGMYARNMVDDGYLPGRRPVTGDHLTLFTVDEIAYWTRQGEAR
jgi:hypothetical protein